MIKKFFIFSFLFFAIASFAQSKDEVLFTIDEKPVYTSEFLRVYHKNKDLILEENQKGVDEYLKMFIDFKLKIKQAYDLKLNEDPEFQKELLKYREQLIVPYLGNKEVTESLLKEAYDRTVNEVNASHILIRVAPDAKPSDTLEAFQKISEAYNKASSGIAFEQVAKEYSQDPSVVQNGGNLGYFSAFSMVYPFENAAYLTEVGDISKPFKTQFGYHILKVNDKRPSKGEIKVAHIFIKNKPEDSVYASAQINDIYKKIQQGEDFAFLAKNFSDDKSSAQKGGVMPKFGTGKLIKPLENVAFSLKDTGSVSKPFSTKYGWHILKLLEKFPVADYDDLKENLKQQIESGNRAVVLHNAFAKKLEENYKIVENKMVLAKLFSHSLTGDSSGEILFTVQDKDYTLSQFEDYLKQNAKRSSQETYTNFKSDMIIAYYKDHLEGTNKEFAATIKEYTDGLLLFDLLQKNIWEKAENDSVGMERFFEKNIDKYQWKTRLNVIIAKCTNAGKAEMVRNYMIEGKSIEQIKELINEGATIHVLFSKAIVEEDTKKLPDGFQLKVGVSPLMEEGKNQYTIVDVKEIIPATSKKISEAKGQVLNDYQNYLEEQWVIDLRNKYNVKVNKKALKNLKRDLNE